MSQKQLKTVRSMKKKFVFLPSVIAYTLQHAPKALFLKQVLSRWELHYLGQHR